MEFIEKEPKICRRRNLVNVPGVATECIFFLVNGFKNLNRSQMKEIQTMHSMVETDFMSVEPLFDKSYK